MSLSVSRKAKEVKPSSTLSITVKAKEMQAIGIDGDGRHHTPHSCRHTFGRLCESFGVKEADRKRMLGHSFGSDITNGVYGHRTVEELRAEIEKILAPGVSREPSHRR